LNNSGNLSQNVCLVSNPPLRSPSETDRGRNCSEWKKDNLATRGAQVTKESEYKSWGSHKGGKKSRKEITIDDF
jgi:hypothetical protein